MNIKKLLKNPSHCFFFLKRLGMLESMSDELYVKFMYKAHMSERLDLENPTTLNEKLQYLKLKNHNPLYTKMVDKYEAKQYIAQMIGDEYIIPTLGVWEKFEDIDFGSLPTKFVLKCTHDSGGLVVCRDKKSLDTEMAQSKITKSLQTNFYKYGREWPYKNVKPQVIAEKYMEDKHSKFLTDYKFYCFSGEPKFLYVSTGLENHDTAFMNFYDLNFKKLPFYRADYQQFEHDLQKPKSFNNMITIAKILSKKIPFVRVDLYEINGQLYFSELTFIPNSGLMPFEPVEWDRKLGDLLILSESENVQ